MRFSFTITALRKVEIINSFRSLLEDNLFQGIEIFYPYQLDEMGKEEYTKAIYRLIKDLDVEVVLHLPHGGFENDLVLNQKQAIKRFYDAIDYGEKFNVKKYTLHLGSTKDKTSEEYLNTSVENLKKLCSYTDAFIMIENMPSKSEVGTSIEEIKYLIEQVNKNNCKFIYDTGHGHVYYKDILKEKSFLKELEPYLKHFHISDNDASRDMHAPIGKGNIDFKDLFSNIIDTYDDLYCLEILYNDKDDLTKYRLDLLKALK